MTVEIAGRPLNVQQVERIANAARNRYGLFTATEGAVTPSSGLTLNVAAISANGAIINGTMVTAAYSASTVTLGTADGANPRRDIVYHDATGAVGVRAGTAAAVPYAPTLADTEQALAEVYVAASATVISTTDILDQRNILARSGMTWLGGDTTERSTTSTTANTVLSTITIPAQSASVPLLVRGIVRKTAGAAAGVELGCQLNSTVIIPANGTLAVTSSTDQVETGTFEIVIPPRVTGYLRAAQLHAYTDAAAGGAVLTEQHSQATADAPTADITSVVIVGRTASASVTLAVDEIHVYSLATGVAG